MQTDALPRRIEPRVTRHVYTWHYMLQKLARVNHVFQPQSSLM
jgi:hypothetical protein